MALYDSAWCLERFNQLAGRPSADDTITDAAKYVRLSEAQQSVVADVMVRCPAALNPKVPYALMPVAAPNQLTADEHPITITGASYAAGAPLTLTTHPAAFTTDSVGDTLWITDPVTGIPLSCLVTAYTSGAIVTATCGVTIPVTMRNVAISGWAVQDTLYPSTQVFAFGYNANGYPIMPMGKAVVFPTLEAWPDFPWVEGYDYISEGTQIRLPNNRTWGDTLYWYGVVQPTDITATANPVLFPEGSRELIVYRAVADFALEGLANDKLAQQMEAKYTQALGRWCLAWKTQFSSGGALGSVSGLRIAEAGGMLNGRNWSAL